MPIRFSTEAANADILGEDPPAAGAAPEGMPQATGANGTPRDHAERAPERDAKANEAKPGKDINAAGFVKDKDSAKPTS